MHHERGEVQSAVAGDAASLLNSELVGGLLEYEEWTSSHGLEQDL